MKKRLKIEEILSGVNVPSEDNGERFINSERLDFIKDFLNKTNFTLVKELDLSLIYRHAKCQKSEPIILISSHIDALYSEYFLKEYNKTELIGTFDNSICNCILLYLMAENRLPSNVFIAFTGDEERNSKGAQETAEFLQENNYNTMMAIVLDITGEGYDRHSFTIENYSIPPKCRFKNYLGFDTEEKMEIYLRRILKDFKRVKFIGDADPDEASEYSDYNLCSFSFCFPTRPHPDNEGEVSYVWMHSDKGILIKKKTIKSYMEALMKLLNGINQTL